MILLRQHALSNGLIFDQPKLILLDEEEKQEDAGDDDAVDADIPKQGKGELFGVVYPETQGVFIRKVEHVVCINYG